MGGKFESLSGHVTFMEIDHEIIIYCYSLPSADSPRTVVSYCQQYVRLVLFNRLRDLSPG